MNINFNPLGDYLSPVIQSTLSLIRNKVVGVALTILGAMALIYIVYRYAKWNDKPKPEITKQEKPTKELTEKKMRKLIIYFPASAGWSDERADGQLTRADVAHRFVTHMLKHQINVEAYFVDPKLANPSHMDAQEISKYPSNFKAVGMAMEDFIKDHPEFFHPSIPAAYISLGLSPLKPGHHASRKDPFIRKNGLYFVNGSQHFDPFQILKRGGYDIQENCFTEELYTYQQGQKLPTTFTSLAILATKMFKKLAHLRLKDSTIDIEQDKRDVSIFVHDFLPDAVSLLSKAEEGDIGELAFQIFTFIAQLSNEVPQRLWLNCQSYYADLVSDDKSFNERQKNRIPPSYKGIQNWPPFKSLS